MMIKFHRFAAPMLLLVAAACSSPLPLGDGSLAGVLPGDWHDSTRTSPEMILRITNDNEPLPFEMVIHAAPTATAAAASWTEVGERTIPAAQTRVGDRWQDNTRDVRVYIRQFSDGRVLEALVDVRFDRGRAEGLLAGLRPTGE